VACPAGGLAHRRYVGASPTLERHAFVIGNLADVHRSVSVPFPTWYIHFTHSRWENLITVLAVVAVAVVVAWVVRANRKPQT